MIKWNHKRLVIEENLVLAAIIGGYVSECLESIIYVELSIENMMRSSRFFVAANKQFKP